MNFINSIILIVLSFLLINCKTEVNSMKVITFTNGEKTELKINSEDAGKIKTIVSELLINTDDMLRLHIDEDRINELKLNEKCIEVIFDSTRIFNTGFLGETAIKKILLPMSGDFQASENIDIVTIIIGEDEYLSGPLTISGGFKLFEELKKIIFTKD